LAILSVFTLVPILLCIAVISPLRSSPTLQPSHMDISATVVALLTITIVALQLGGALFIRWISDTTVGRMLDLDIDIYEFAGYEKPPYPRMLDWLHHLRGVDRHSGMSHRSQTRTPAKS
jgi:hypothetical protein